MFLYHGSNMAVETPKLIEQTRGLDFGAGLSALLALGVLPRWDGGFPGIFLPAFFLVPLDFLG